MKGSGDFSIGSKVWPGISKLLEESGEVMQVCGKLIGTGGEIQHWDGTNLKERLEDELGDELAAIIFVVRHCGLNVERVSHQREMKLATFEHWHETAPTPPTQKQTTIMICGVLGETCITTEDGERVQHVLKSYLQAGDNVILDFENVTVLSVPFLSAVIGELVKGFTVDEFLRRVQAHHLPAGLEMTFERVVCASWEYFHDDKVKAVVDEMMG